jgi:Protein of unknown function (DUF1207)
MCRLPVCLTVVLIAASHAYAGQPPGPDKVEGQHPTTWKPTRTRSIELFPAGDIFPVYAADPHRPTNHLAVGFYPTTDIPETSSPRTTLSGGGRFGILRIDSTPAGRSWQISLDAGFDGMFDSQYSNDSVGWDGNYGVTVTTTAQASPFAFKLAVLHVSAHLGDEYGERTHAPRLNYTREELAVAAAWQPRSHARLYTELGVAYLMRTDDQHRMRVQMGGEYERPPTVFGGRMAWYGAVDFSLLAERDWRLDTSVQGGLVTRNNGRTYRIYSQWYDGRPTLGQFTAYSEAALTVGFKVDL